MKTKVRTAIAVGCITLLLADPRAAAQTPAASAEMAGPPEHLTASERQSAVNGALAHWADPTLRSAASGPTPMFILQASSTSST